MTISCLNISAPTSSFHFPICVKVPRLDNFLFYYFFISAVVHTCIASACVHFIVNVCTVTVLLEKNQRHLQCACLELITFPIPKQFFALCIC